MDLHALRKDVAFKKELLKQEVDLVMQKEEHFDGLRHRTRQMAVTLWTAIIGIGLAGQMPPLLILFAVAVLLPFWYLDARYHQLTEGHVLRRLAIEAYLNNRSSPWNTQSPVTEELTFPVPDYWGKHTPSVKDEHKKRTRMKRCLFTGRMLWLYGPLCTIPAILALLLWQLGYPT